MLCGTREDVAAKAMAFHATAGLGLPLLQPVVQEDHQVDELIAAAAMYAAAAGAVDGDGRPAGEAPGRRSARERRRRSTPLADDRRLGAAAGSLRRRAGGVWEILRPFAYTASVMPVVAGGALAAVDQQFTWLPFLAALVGGVLLHSGTNVVNEIYDVRKGIDTITSPAREPRDREGPGDRAVGVRRRAGVAFVLAIVVGVYLIALRGPAIVGLGILGARRRLLLHRPAVRSTSTARSACRSSSCSWAR